MSEGVERVCVILGAGASHDVRNGLPESHELRLPLAEKLFDGTNLACRKHLDSYPGAGTIAENLLYDQVGGSRLEDALRYYAQHPTSEVLREHYKKVPPYIRDLIWDYSEKTPSPTGYIRLVTRLLEEHSYEVLFLVLNYDNLLEKALKSLEPDRYTFKEMQHYVKPGRPAKVVKIHGSVDWFIPLRGPKSSWDECVYRLNILDRPNAIDVKVIEKIEITSTGRQPDSLWGWGYDPWVYPVLTAPLAGKQLDNIVCPDSHREFAESFLSTCQRFLVIGSSGTDDDLMKLLDRSIPANRHMRLVHVVGKKDAETTSGQFKKGVKAFREDATFSQFYNGFQEYLVDPSFQSFCDGRWD